jgi:antitoxin Phd
LRAFVFLAGLSVLQSGSAQVKSWKAREARAKFSELVREALKDGPQVITRNGKEKVVVVSLEQWQTVQRAATERMREVLIEGPRFDLKLPNRMNWRFRRPIKFV